MSFVMLCAGAVYTEVNSLHRQIANRGRGDTNTRVSRAPTRAPPAPPQIPNEVYGNEGEITSPRYVSVYRLVVGKCIYIMCETSGSVPSRKYSGKVWE